MGKIVAVGTPRPKGSKRHVGGGRMVEASKYLPGWEKQIVEACRSSYEGETLDGPVTAIVEFVFPRPKALKPEQVAPPHITPGDLDKLQRAVGDALTKAEVIKDDAQINTWIAHKRRASYTEEPGAYFTIAPAKPGDFLWDKQVKGD